MTDRVRTVFLGSGRFGVPTLRILSVHPHVELVGVVTAPPRPAGRGGRVTHTPVDEAASDVGVPVLRPLRLREAVGDVLALDPEMAVLADYGQLVPRTLLDLPHGALNLHPSLLPRHRGASPIPATILADDAETGVTLMKMDAGLDTGPIVAQQRLPLTGAETALALEDELADAAAKLVPQTLRAWLSGTLQPTPQDEQRATMTQPLRREDGRLDSGQPAEYLVRQVRAYQPWPGTYFDTPAGRIIVWRARARPGDAVPGLIVALHDRVPVIGTADGLLELVEVQPAGRKRMSGVELVRGRPQLIGTRIHDPSPASSVQER